MKLTEKFHNYHGKTSKLSEKIKKKTTETDSLSSNKFYLIEEKPLTLIEREKLEEELLDSKLKDLTFSLKSNDKEGFLKNIMDLGKESLHSNSNSFNFSKRTSSFNSLDKTYFLEYTKNNISDFLNSCKSTNTSDSFRQMICQNVEVSVEKLKLIVLGDKHTGKSLFVSRYTDDRNLGDLTYIPTEK